MNLGEAVAAYLSERKRNGSLNATSIVKVRSTLWRFGDYFGVEREPASLAVADVSEWIAELGVGPRSVRCYVSHVRGLFTWLLLRDEITRDPFIGIRLPKEPDSVPRAFEAEATGAILAACKDAREELIVLLMVQEGLRASEVCHLEAGHVSLSRASVLVRAGKGGKDRSVPLTDETRRAIAAYLSEWPAVGAGPLIRSLHDGRASVSPNRMSHILSAIMYRAGVKLRPHDGNSGHALRHTAASDVLVAADNDVRVVAEFLGHKSIKTSEIYLRTVAADRLRSAVNGRTYRSAS